MKGSKSIAGEGKLDAGLRSINHYRSKFPPWRYAIRQQCLSLLRRETLYLAWAQERFRSPALDSYFAITANLGTHTFFMVAIPVLFWCGYTTLGRVMIHTLACGVFFSGFLKDYLCLPRPLSPPLQRISMSRSAPLEYGFPSTHSTNAMSVVVYTILALKSPENTIQPTTQLIIKALLFVYASSIILGRLYCGMHGFADVMIGGLLGSAFSWIEWTYGGVFDNWIYSGSYTGPLITTLIIIFLVRIHPEPADDCPCFDDSVAFAGVIIGCEFGCCHYAGSGWAWDYPVPATVPFRIQEMGWILAVARVIFGVFTILAWREVMKPSLLRGLPPIFRVFERFGLNLPRKFFVQASEYKKVPTHQKDDNVVPSITEIPELLSSMRHPRRRAVSVGPQSAADAYETLAYREKRRRESQSSAGTPVEQGNTTGSAGYFALRPVTQLKNDTVSAPRNAPLTPPLSKVGSYEQMMGTGSIVLTPAISISDESEAQKQNALDQKENERQDNEMFSGLEKPRVRYDVEVVTKLIVYAGIGLLAVEGSAVLMDLVGLGLSDSVS